MEVYFFSLLAVNFYFFIQSNDNFFINTIIDSFKLQIQGGQKPIIDFFTALIIPFKINPFQLINDLINSKGGLIRLIFSFNVIDFLFKVFLI